MRIVVTGAAGFIGSNLRLRLRELGYDDVVAITREATGDQLIEAVSGADFAFHLAGVNRPKDIAEFATGNAGFTEELCRALAVSGRRTPVAFASSTQAALENPYGRSKRAAEEALLRYGGASGAPVYLFRLTNVFGKWCRPNYNSAVATFCHNIARGLPIRVDDPPAPLRLVYIDDVLEAFTRLLAAPELPGGYLEVAPVYETTVGNVVETLRRFADSRTSLVMARVGEGLVRALHSTYLSYLPPDRFDYPLVAHPDPRGVFVEMLRTPDCGQFSYFTAHPGITRGGHYHHSKTEKFLVIEGQARFGFRHILTDETFEIVTSGTAPRVVETVPGWAHDITNIGEGLMVVLLWANEVFDKDKPDTIAAKV